MDKQKDVYLIIVKREIQRENGDRTVKDHVLATRSILEKRCIIVFLSSSGKHPTDWFLLNPDPGAFQDLEDKKLGRRVQLPGYLPSDSLLDSIVKKRSIDETGFDPKGKQYLPREIKCDKNGEAMIQKLKDLIPKLGISDPRVRRSEAALTSMLTSEIEPQNHTKGEHIFHAIQTMGMIKRKIL